MRIGLVLAAMVIFLVACQPQVQEQASAHPTQFVCPDGRIVQDASLCEEEETFVVEESSDVADPTGSVVESGSEEQKTVFQETFGSDEVASGEISDDVNEIRGRASDKTKNGYSYNYYERDDKGIVLGKLDGARVSVHKSKRLFEFDDRIKLIDIDAFSHILVDESDDSATAWCEVDCSEPAFDITSDLVDFPTATYWLDHLESASKRGQKSLKGRTVFILDAVVAGLETEILVDSFSGVPMEVTVGEKTYVYENLGLGVDQDAFVVPN